MADSTPRTESDMRTAWPPAEGATRTEAKPPGTRNYATGRVTAEPDPATAATTPPAIEPTGPTAVAMVADERPRKDKGLTSLQRSARMVWLLWMTVELIVGLRVIFKGVAANPDAGFVSFINTISAPLISPFHSIMRDRAIGSHGGLLEISSLMAIVVYFAGALIVASFLRIIGAPKARPAAS